LSRACLGKMFVYIYKWLKQHRFLTGGKAPTDPVWYDTIASYQNCL
jgi:hypothetical protein